MQLCEGGSVIELVRAMHKTDKKLCELHLAYILKDTIKVNKHVNKSYHLYNMFVILRLGRDLPAPEPHYASWYPRQQHSAHQERRNQTLRLWALTVKNCSPTFYLGFFIIIYICAQRVAQHFGQERLNRGLTMLDGTRVGHQRAEKYQNWTRRLRQSSWHLGSGYNSKSKFLILVKIQIYFFQESRPLNWLMARRLLRMFTPRALSSKSSATRHRPFTVRQAGRSFLTTSSMSTIYICKHFLLN